jgi:hypothetical protein
VVINEGLSLVNISTTETSNSQEKDTNERDSSLNSANTNALQLMQAMLLVLNDRRARTDAIFLHGSCVKDDYLDDLVIEEGVSAARSMISNMIVINGAPIAGSAGIAYAGAEVWMKKLVPQLETGLGEAAISVTNIPQARHTAAEVKNFIALAKERGWKSVTIVSLPHHILRCMRTWAAIITAEGSDLKVYARTPDAVPWWTPAAKPVLDGPDIQGTLFDHIEREFQQGERFQNKAGADERGKFTPHATLDELIEYYRERDGVIPELAPGEFKITQMATA